MPQRFVTEFKYLGNIINNKFSDDDDDDMKREMRNMFMRSNILLRRYSKCSLSVMLTVCKAYCVCFYDIGLWRNFSRTMFKLTNYASVITNV